MQKDLRKSSTEHCSACCFRWKSMRGHEDFETAFKDCKMACLFREVTNFGETFRAEIISLLEEQHAEIIFQGLKITELEEQLTNLKDEIIKEKKDNSERRASTPAMSVSSYLCAVIVLTNPFTHFYKNKI